MEDPNAHLDKAEKMLAKAGSGFSFFGGRDEKYMEAAEQFVVAANSYKMQKKSIDAGRAFERAAEIHTKHLNDLDEAANILVDAYKAYDKDDPGAAARVIQIPIQQYCAKGNFRRAATHQENLAATYMRLGEQGRALAALEQAAEWYEGDKAFSLANKLLLRVADELAADKDASADDLHRAIANYERVAEHSVSNNMMRYSVRDYLLKATLCHMCIDAIDAQHALERYRELDPTFSRERECELLVDLLEAQSEKDHDRFTDVLLKYDERSRLDQWKVKICNRIKNSIEMQGDEEDFA